MRIGHGYDVHALAEHRDLIIGGVKIPYELGLLGHSDADVLAHAVSDALLGAAALGDIGVLFPDSDPKYEGADSLKLLSAVVAAVRMNRAVIAAMRSRGGGRIVNLSSVAAPVPIPFQTYYSASKAAINSYTMALANELRPFGITVCAVMPGDIHTGFTAARRKVAEGDEIYAGRISRSVKRMEHDEQTGMDPAKAGAFVGRVALKTGHKPLYTIGFAYKAAVFLTKILPAGALNWLIGKIYAS